MKPTSDGDVSEMSEARVERGGESQEVAALLSQGLVNHYGATFLCVANSLEKLNTRQEILTVATQEESEKLSYRAFKHLSC